MLVKRMEKFVVDFMEKISAGLEDDESMDG